MTDICLSEKPLTVYILTEFWNIYIFYDDIMQFVKVNFSTIFTTQITSIAPCGDELLILANSHLYQASIQHKVPKMYQLDSDYQEYGTKKDIAQFICSKLTIKRVQHSSNVKEVCCDSDGESFIALLSHVALKPLDIQKDDFDYSMLLDDGMQHDNKILDVEFLIDNQAIRASRFIVAARCEFLKNLMKIEQLRAVSLTTNE